MDTYRNPAGSGFYYLKTRYYDPNTGRFISSDVMLSTGQGVIGNNSYAYCRNNPVSRFDLLGKEDEETDSVYIIYTDYSSEDNGGGRSGDFTKQAKYYADLLGCPDKHMFSIKTVDDFIDVWNNRIGESADIVYVFSYGNGMSLIFLKGEGISATGYNSKGEKIDAIGNLHHKSIHKLYLMSCNSGHKDLYFEKGTNVAAAFVRLGGIDEVYAFNGSMSYYRIFSRKARLSWTQSGYYEVYKNFELNSPVSNPSGWVKYILK